MSRRYCYPVTLRVQQPRIAGRQVLWVCWRHARGRSCSSLQMRRIIDADLPVQQAEASAASGSAAVQHRNRYVVRGRIRTCRRSRLASVPSGTREARSTNAAAMTMGRAMLLVVPVQRTG